MTDAAAADRLFAEIPEFARWYKEEREEDAAWNVFGLQGFAGFISEVLVEGSDDALIRRCFDFVERLATDPAHEDMVEVQLMENLGQHHYELVPELKQKAIPLLGPKSAELLARNEESWRHVEEAQVSDPSFEPWWVSEPALAEPFGPLTVTVRRVTAKDVRTVLLVLTNAGAWLHSKGITEQWPASFISDPEWQERFRRWTAEGRVFLADGGLRGALGCFRLMDSDDHIWAGEPDSALYLHSLALVRWVAGQGVAETMLDWALQHAAAWGAQELRLDCWAGNERLKQYYLDGGFEARGEAAVNVEGRSYFVAKFAKKTR